jgi:DNA-binding NarL/FixJ family response regulator
VNKFKSNYSAHRFLIADDKPYLRNLIQSMLVRCQARDVDHAADGAEAIEVLNEARGAIDCVLCASNMEPMDGVELLKSVRAGDVRHTPRDQRFIMLTGHGEDSVVRAALALDTNGYVVKPVSMEKLIRAIDAALANTVALKPEEEYRSMSPLDLPGASLAPGNRTPN